MKIIITEEQNEQLNNKVRLVVEKLGLGQSRQMFGDGLIKQAYIDNPLSFLEQFNNLKPVEVGDKICYVDNDGKTLLYYYEEDLDLGYGYCHINHKRIWGFYSEVMGFLSTKIQKIMMDWISTTYNMKSLVPQWY